jgi:hypothetical protein
MEEDYLRKSLNPSPNNNNNPYKNTFGSSFRGIAGSLAPLIYETMLKEHGNNPVTDAFQALLRGTINARDRETGKGFNISPGSVDFSLGDFDLGFTADKNNPGVRFGLGNFNLDFTGGKDPRVYVRFNFTKPPKPQNTIENTRIPGNEPNPDSTFKKKQEELDALIGNDLNRFRNPSLPFDDIPNLFDRLRKSYPNLDPYYR